VRLLATTSLCLIVACFCLATSIQAANELRVATFCCDVTPPLGQPMFDGDPLRIVEEPLLAKGIVLQAGTDRYVICAFDWCEMCNGSHDQLQKVLAAAADTQPSHVAVQALHQHTAPLVDSDAQKLLAKIGAGELMLDPKVLSEFERRLTAAVKQSLAELEPVDQIGIGQARVERVASSRRPVDTAGKLHIRWSVCLDQTLQTLPEGHIDPYLKTITLARGRKPLVRLHYYATHPQTKFSDNRGTSDFPGMARERLQRKEGVFQIYFTGCGGDITVGKYNDGSKKCREQLANRLFAGMEASIAATKLLPVGPVRWRTTPFVLIPRTDPGHTMADYAGRMSNPKIRPSDRVYPGALRVAFLNRSQQPIQLNSLEIGNVHILHLPGEPLIDFQFYAQGLKPNDFVAVAGYGDCATGYICPEKAFREGGYEPTDSCVKPESEAGLKKAIANLLGVE
jgi:hypothetical protein